MNLNEQTKSNFDVEKVRLQLKRWQEKLLDMSKSNPLLGLNRARAARLKIKDPGAFSLFKRLVLEEAELHLPFVKKVKIKKSNNLSNQEEDFKEEEIFEIEKGDIEFEINTPVDLKRRLRRIYDNARTTIEERGVVTLYTAFGTIHWSDDALGDSMSPLLLVPCELISKGPNVALRLRMTDEEIQINPAIIYYFREKHKIDLHELAEITAELNESSLKVLFQKIQEKISEQGWKVVEELWLGTFSFVSLVMYQDLKLLTDQALSNTLIAAFAHALLKPVGQSEQLSDDLDSLKTPEIVPIPILPADSSQLKALTYAAMGKHLVIHGPPGTGKSQTISNIIADALGKNKKVLFVSAKIAALNVVFNRLKEEGLGQFCLEAHGVKAGKLKIVEDLKRTIESEDSNNLVSLEEELKSLQNTKQQLNEYVVVLHKVINPLGRSLFQAIGRFAQLEKVPYIKGVLPWKDVLEVSKDEFNICHEAITSVAQMSELFDSRKKHPWRDFVSLDYNLQLQEQVEADLKFLLQNFTEIDSVIKRLKKLLPLQDFTLENLSSLVPALDAISRTKKLPESWWNIDISLIKDSKTLLTTSSLLAKEFNEKEVIYHNFSDLSFKETVDLLSEITSTFKSWKNRFTISYFKWQRKVKHQLKEKTKGGYKNFLNYYEIAKRLAFIEDWFEQKKPILNQEISSQSLRDPIAFDKAAEACKTVILLFEALSNYSWDNSKVTFIEPEISKAAAAFVSMFNSRIKLINETSKKIDAWWPNGFIDKIPVNRIPILQFNIRANEVLININKMREWVLLQKTIKHCKDLEFSDFIEVEAVSASLLPNIFEKRFLKLWIDAFINKTPRLAEFTGLGQQELITKFRMLDVRIRRLAKINIIASAAVASRGIKTAQSGLGNSSEIGILRFEMQKKKRIRPLRKLFSEIPHVLQALKPCMLMSPVSVSTYLKPETFHFDIVIFDEASQLPTPEAIPSILRADQVIVAGDPKQLPPTPFFVSTLMGDDVEDYEEELFQTQLESLLDNCVAIVPFFQEAYLKWHYRSRDERLINFSNYYFYDNRLITFPSVCTNNICRGVELEYISDGIWDRGRSRVNRKEARRAAQLAIEHFTKFPQKSLGIVAMNTYQREAIEDAISEELIKRPELLPFFDSSRQEAFFIKSLENVQGDERDVIIISVGYGKDNEGNLTLNFGPLNMEGGWRRLNVLVTRAKWQTVLITSLRSAELHRINPENRGAMALKNFIEYLERKGSLPPSPARITEGETNDFEDTVREVLRERGFNVDAQVGAGSFRIDLAVRDPRDSSKYLIGIECDGATYHSSTVARDRDMVREEILRVMGWKFHRIWSTEWFRNRDTTIKLMLENINKAVSNDQLKSMPVAPYVEEKAFSVKLLPVVEIERRYKPGIPYSKYKKQSKKEILMRDTGSYRYHLERILLELIDYEGPIHQDILDERLKEVFKIKKIGANIRSNLKRATRSAINDQELERKKSFIYKKEKKIESFRTPGDDVKRTIHYISSQEIALAILYLVEDQFGLVREQIPQAISKIFEITRTEPEENDRIREITDSLVEKGKLIVNGNKINLPLL